MKRSTRLLLIGLKLVLVAALVVWLYTRAETEMHGERAEVVSARGNLTAAAPGGPGAIELEQSRAAELYDLVREGSWARGEAGESRGTVELIYSNGETDQMN